MSLQITLSISQISEHPAPNAKHDSVMNPTIFSQTKTTTKDKYC